MKLKKQSERLKKQSEKLKKQSEKLRNKPKNKPRLKQTRLKRNASVKRLKRLQRMLRPQQDVRRPKKKPLAYVPLKLKLRKRQKRTPNGPRRLKKMPSANASSLKSETARTRKTWQQRLLERLQKTRQNFLLNLQNQPRTKRRFVQLPTSLR